MVRHLLKISDFTKEECVKVINNGIKVKKNPNMSRSELEGEMLLMLFEKPSLRTRISFETGMQKLGGHAIFYSIKDSPLGKKESISDTAKVASRFVNLIAARVFKRQNILRVIDINVKKQSIIGIKTTKAKYKTKFVINAAGAQTKEIGDLLVLIYLLNQNLMKQVLLNL